jgi:hypothetical protein
LSPIDTCRNRIHIQEDVILTEILRKAFMDSWHLIDGVLSPITDEDRGVRTLGLAEFFDLTGRRLNTSPG